MSRRVVIVGASRGIGREVARRFAARGDALVVAARDEDELDRVAVDLRTRYRGTVHPIAIDVCNAEQTREFASASRAALRGAIDVLVLCQGVYWPQSEADGRPDRVESMLETNASSAMGLAERFLPEMTVNGVLAAVSSVAGDRPRASNFAYGCSKAALNAYLEGLRLSKRTSGRSIVIIKPGIVDTSLTWGDATSIAASPKRVAADIERAIDRRTKVMYTPWQWRWIMLTIRCIPGPIFARLKL